MTDMHTAFWTGDREEIEVGSEGGLCVGDAEFLREHLDEVEAMMAPEKWNDFRRDVQRAAVEQQKKENSVRHGTAFEGVLRLSSGRMSLAGLVQENSVL
ncbi:hypothetical protein [Schaalia sp. 19OD2882]|uniref:hypothetical protein n=1 Tax=Schaalia sp. 19OD2882 TaxID=2794089 RepID=UPI001C1F1078|nr:hypothetical protein [Schaalia sp. 19OD2882]